MLADPKGVSLTLSIVTPYPFLPCPSRVNKFWPLEAMIGILKVCNFLLWAITWNTLPFHETWPKGTYNSASAVGTYSNSNINLLVLIPKSLLSKTPCEIELCLLELSTITLESFQCLFAFYESETSPEPVHPTTNPL